MDCCIYPSFCPSFSVILILGNMILCELYELKSHCIVETVDGCISVSICVFTFNIFVVVYF